MIIKGYLLAKYYPNGVGSVAIKIDNLYRPIFFKKLENVENFIDRVYGSKSCLTGLSPFKADIYVDNKIIYEDNTDLIDSVDIEEFISAV